MWLWLRLTICPFDNFTLRTLGHTLWQHDLVISVGLIESCVHKPDPQFQNLICEQGCHTPLSGDTAGFQPVLQHWIELCLFKLWTNTATICWRWACSAARVDSVCKEKTCLLANRKWCHLSSSWPSLNHLNHVLYLPIRGKIIWGILHTSNTILCTSNPFFY